MRRLAAFPREENRVEILPPPKPRDFFGLRLCRDEDACEEKCLSFAVNATRKRTPQQDGVLTVESFSLCKGLLPLNTLSEWPPAELSSMLVLHAERQAQKPAFSAGRLSLRLRRLPPEAARGSDSPEFASFSSAAPLDELPAGVFVATRSDTDKAAETNSAVRVPASEFLHGEALCGVAE